MKDEPFFEIRITLLAYKRKYFTIFFSLIDWNDLKNSSVEN
jgi:hypothetical protein